MNEREKTLVERVLSGDLSAFEPLITPYRKPLLGLAYRIARNSEDAKEVAQETFLRAFKYLKNFNVEKSFKSWIYQILVHAARNYRNKQVKYETLRMSEPVKETAVAGGDDPERRHDDEEIRSRLMDCLDVLTPREKEVFLLRDIEEMNIQETAKILRCSAISVRVHLSAARKKIKERIKDRYPEYLGREP
jgi:RNA polymerase sigma-70 factor (ECF subfamily)